MSIVASGVYLSRAVVAAAPPIDRARGVGDSREPCRPCSTPSWPPRRPRRTHPSSARRRRPAAPTIRTASSSPTRPCARRCCRFARRLRGGRLRPRPSRRAAASRTGPSSSSTTWPLNALGCGVVPDQPGLPPRRAAYQMDHSEADLAVSIAERVGRPRGGGARAREAAAGGGRGRCPARCRDPGPAPRARRARPRHRVRPALHLGHHRPAQGLRADQLLLPERRAPGTATWAGGSPSSTGRERFLNPLPLFHMNCQAVTATCAILTANCLILPERFSPTPLVARRRRHAGHHHPLPRRDAAAAPQPALRRRRSARTASSSASAPASSRELHEAFEERFGFPLIEVWGMTETGRIFADSHRAARRSTRARSAGRSAASRRASWTTRTATCRAGPRASSSCAGAARRARATASSRAISRTRRRPRRRGAAAGSTPATWCARTPTACSSSSTARRTSSAARARTSRPPRSRPCSRRTRPWRRWRCWPCPTRSARRRSWPAWCRCRAPRPTRALAEDLQRLVSRAARLLQGAGLGALRRRLPTTGTQKVQKTQIFPRGRGPAPPPRRARPARPQEARLTRHAGPRGRPARMR